LQLSAEFPVSTPVKWTQGSDVIRGSTSADLRSVNTSPATRPRADDLDSRAQIHNLVVSFYREIIFDDLLGPVFEEVAEVDWTLHIPRLIDYWCRILLGEPGFDGYILRPHQHLHALQALTPEMFDRWYQLFSTSVDTGWSGPLAELAKTHAARTASSIASRLLHTKWPERSD
jgi:hemoglobin